MSVTLRPYQSDAVNRANAALGPEIRRVLLVAPTGAGKTVIAAHIIEAAHARGSRVIFFAHRRELIDQTYRKLIGAGVSPDRLGVMMGDDARANPEATVQIASIQTWGRRKPPPADFVFIDECHRVLANTYRRAIAHYSTAAVLGLTATPYRANGKPLGDVFQKMVVVANPRQLITQGFLVEPRVFSVPKEKLPNLVGIQVSMGDYVRSKLAAAVNTGSLVGNIVDHWLDYAEGRRTVAFAVNVAHSKAIAAAFVAAGVAAEHIDRKTPVIERQAILNRLKAGQTKVVSNCGILCEGWDMPSVKCAIIARPTKSPGLYLQQAGRIMRPWEGVGALVLDHAGNAIKHGLPQDDREFSLDPPPDQKGIEGEAPAKACPECCEIVPAGQQVCRCGYEFPCADTPAVAAPGMLVEITEEIPELPPPPALSIDTPPLRVLKSPMVEEYGGRSVLDDPVRAINLLLPAPRIMWAAENRTRIYTAKYSPHERPMDGWDKLWARESAKAAVPSTERPYARMVDVIYVDSARLLATVIPTPHDACCSRHTVRKGRHKRNGCGDAHLTPRGGKPCPNSHYSYKRPAGMKGCAACQQQRETQANIKITIRKAAAELGLHEKLKAYLRRLLLRA